MFKKAKQGTKTILADILLKRGMRKEITSLREGELGYVMDEKRVIIGTLDGTEDLAMKVDIEAAVKSFNDNADLLSERISSGEDTKKNKVLDRITNADVNFMKELKNNLSSGEMVIISKKDLDALIKKAGGDID